jgi:hypothetical protein
MVLFRKRRYMFIAPLELSPWCVSGNPYGEIGTIAPYGYLAKEFQIQVRVRVLVRVILFPVLVHVLALVLVHVLVRVLVRIRVQVNLKYGAINIYFLHGNYVADSQGSYKMARKIKGPPS